MADKATKTIRIKWVRSGIGFPSRQKEIVRSLGLRKLNQVVERPDTPQIRGIIAKVPHLLSIVGSAAAPAWALIPEYTVRPPEVTLVEKAGSAPEGTLAGAEAAASESEPSAAAGGETAPAKELEPEPTVEAPATSKETNANKIAAPAAAKKAKSAKAADQKPKKGEKEAAAAKKGRPVRAGKK